MQIFTGAMMGKLYRKSLLLAASALVIGALSCAQDPPKTLPPRYADLTPKPVPGYLKGTVLERMRHDNPEILQVSSFGLVVNLPGTGDPTAPTAVREYMIKEMTRRRFGSIMGSPELQNMPPERVLDDPLRRTAIVRVDGFMPPGIRKGQSFDVVVTALDDSGVTSLAGGSLWQSELKFGGAEPNKPEGGVQVEALAEGPIFLNPAVALNPRTSATSRSVSRISRRQGTILDGGRCQDDQKLILRLYQPQRSMIKQIETRIDQFFLDPTVASAKNEAYLELSVPTSFNGDWERFLGIVLHLYVDGTPETLTARARILAQEALKPDAPLLDISFAWEAMGEVALPALTPLMAGSQPQDVQFAAARAAAFIGDPTAQQALLRIASTEGHSQQLPAVRTLGALKNTPGINSMIRRLLNSPSSLVRIEAYKVLASHHTADIESHILPRKGVDERFVLDIVRSTQSPIIYATRSGIPRIALIGGEMNLQTPLVFSALDDRLTLSTRAGVEGVTLFYRQGGSIRPAQVQSRPELAELLGWLGGAGTEPGTRVSLTYGEIVAVIQALADQNRLWASGSPTGRSVPVQFVLQESAEIQDLVNDAPSIVPRVRSQSGGDAPDFPTTRRVGKPPEGKAPESSDKSSGN